MTAQEINKARELSKRIRELERQIAALCLSRDNIVPVLDGMPHASDLKSKVEKFALQIVENQRVLEDLRVELAQEKLRLVSVITAEFDDPTAQSLLLLRYVSCLSFREIARRMSYGLRHVFKLHDRLLKMAYKETQGNAGNA